MNLYTVAEIAKILNSHEGSVRRLLSDGKIKAYKVGKSWRVYEDDLRAYIEQKPNRKE